MQTASGLFEAQGLPTQDVPRPLSLLLVDDSPTFLRILRRFLEAEGGSTVQVVGTATGSSEALAQAAALRPDLILLDVSMPDRSGLELLPRLRRLLPQAGIITLTLLHPDLYQATALAAGADAFVTKVTLDTELLPTIRQVAIARQIRANPPGRAEGGHVPPR